MENRMKNYESARLNDWNVTSKGLFYKEKRIGDTVFSGVDKETGGAWVMFINKNIGETDGVKIGKSALKEEFIAKVANSISKDCGYKMEKDCAEYFGKYILDCWNNGTGTKFLITIDDGKD